MSGFKRVVLFFNSKRSNKIFTRAEYMILRKYDLRVSYLDTLRCYLENAGYLKNEEAGVYRKLRKIPVNLTYTQLYKEAYPR